MSLVFFRHAAFSEQSWKCGDVEDTFFMYSIAFSNPVDKSGLITMSSVTSSNCIWIGNVVSWWTANTLISGKLPNILVWGLVTTMSFWFRSPVNCSLYLVYLLYIFFNLIGQGDSQIQSDWRKCKVNKQAQPIKGIRYKDCSLKLN